MASFSVPCPKCPLVLKTQKVSFQSGLSLKPSLSFGSLSAETTSPGIRLLNKKRSAFQKLQAIRPDALTVENSNSAPALVSGPKDAASKVNEDHNGKVPNGNGADASAISGFMAQVADLVKLVDSKDIVELQLKQSDYELTIRKKEALEPPPAAFIAPSPAQFPYPTLPSLLPPPAAAASAPASSTPSKAALALPSPGKASTSSHPPLLSPMAGTFYRSPAPGEPPFVKVGDKVQKGQVVCIIEAMKLMNEIEAEKSGTVAEVLAEDGKPISLDTPLFLIVP